MTRKDEDIKRDIVNHLYWDARLDASKISVIVEEGRVRLEGTVPHHLAFRSAVRDVWDVQGVLSVENRMQVVSTEVTIPPTNTELKDSIENILKWNPNTRDADITISMVDEGKVTMEGFVDAYWKKLHAEKLVSDVHGVKEIINKLSVVPTKAFSDEAIAGEVLATLERNAAVDSRAIGIKVERGEVTLTGRVANWGARTAAFYGALYTKGVVHVNDRLTVKNF